jgi:hypothetical protein
MLIDFKSFFAVTNLLLFLLWGGSAPASPSPDFRSQTPAKVFVQKSSPNQATARVEQYARTPKPGSPERQAICDAARSYVLSKYTTSTLPQPIVFKIDHISVQESYCNFEAIPLFKDGSYIDPRYIADIGFNFCLRKSGDRWNVIVDLSRTDVPDATELETIRKSIPRDFPAALFSPTWRKLLFNSP